MRSHARSFLVFHLFLLSALTGCQGPKLPEVVSAQGGVEDYVTQALEARSAANLPLNTTLNIPASVMVPPVISTPPQPQIAFGNMTSNPGMPATGALVPNPSAVGEILGVPLSPPAMAGRRQLVIKVRCNGIVDVKMTMATGNYFMKSPVSVLFTYREETSASSSAADIEGIVETYLALSRQNIATHQPGVKSVSCKLVPVPECQAPQTQTALASAGDACSAAPNIIGD